MNISQDTLDRMTEINLSLIQRKVMRLLGGGLIHTTNNFILSKCMRAYTEELAEIMALPSFRQPEKLELIDALLYDSVPVHTIRRIARTSPNTVFERKNQKVTPHLIPIYTNWTQHERDAVNHLKTIFKYLD